MPRETEIKLPIRDPKVLLRALKRLGARPVASRCARVHELNVIFDTPQGGLAKHGQLLRIRTEASPAPSRSKRARVRPSRSVVTFKRPPVSSPNPGPQHQHSHGYKVRDEFELEVSDPATLIQIFEGLGMAGWFRYEKYRTTYSLPGGSKWANGLLLELDETPIGTFLELEGPPEAIDRAAHELGYSKRDYILKNYLALYVEECRRNGQEPLNMLFDTPPRAGHSKKPK